MVAQYQGGACCQINSIARTSVNGKLEKRRKYVQVEINLRVTTRTCLHVGDCRSGLKSGVGDLSRAKRSHRLHWKLQWNLATVHDQFRRHESFSGNKLAGDRI